MSSTTLAGLVRDTKLPPTPRAHSATSITGPTAKSRSGGKFSHLGLVWDTTLPAHPIRPRPATIRLSNDPIELSCGTEPSTLRGKIIEKVLSHLFMTNGVPCHSRISVDRPTVVSDSSDQRYCPFIREVDLLIGSSEHPRAFIELKAKWEGQRYTELPKQIAWLNAAMPCIYSFGVVFTRSEIEEGQKTIDVCTLVDWMQRLVRLSSESSASQRSVVQGRSSIYYSDLNPLLEYGLKNHLIGEAHIARAL